jgi:hypothetical protein
MESFASFTKDVENDKGSKIPSLEFKFPYLLLHLGHAVDRDLFQDHLSAIGYLFAEVNDPEAVKRGESKFINDLNLFNSLL